MRVLDFVPNSPSPAARPAPTAPQWQKSPPWWRGWLAAAAAIAFTATAPAIRAADLPWNYAVQVTATVEPGPSQVVLQWTPPDPNALGGLVPQHIVYRKRVANLANPDWGQGTVVPAGQNSFTDTVQPGVAYEYKIVRQYSGVDPQFNGVGYVRTGIAVPLVEQRGTLLLVVDSAVADALASELDQFTQDCEGDGWQVVRIDGFSAASNPADLQARIRQEYQTDDDVQAVFLVGNLPVVLSGTATNPDGHFIRPMPADGFFGDVTGDWGPATYNGQFWTYQKNTFPAPVALEVGRLDFAEMPGVAAASPYGTEVGLLKNYFAKDHAYRIAQRVPQQRALIGDAMGEYYYQGVVEPFSADGYRNFAPLVGNQITVADKYHGADNTSNWLADLAAGSYEWAYGCGAGGDSGDSIAALGPNDELTSTDLVAQNAQADFYLLFGSFVVDWTKPDNLLRAALAPADYGLASAWAGRPFLYFHAMGLGETIGYGIRASENGSGSLYDTPVKVRPSGNTYVGGVYMALMGDPTLRLDPVPPVTNLSVDNATGAVSWTPPAGVAVQEYRVYWQNPGSGRFELENTVPAAAASYTPTHTGRHMIRAVMLDTRSGTFFNASEGVFWDAATANPSGPSTGGINPPPSGGGSPAPLPVPPGSPGPEVGPVSVPDPALPRATFGIPLLIPTR